MDPAAYPTLDPELAGFLTVLPDMADALDDLPGARSMLEAMVAPQDYPGEGRLEISDHLVEGAPGAPEVPVRVYRPRDRGEAPLPGLLHLHGGGFCLGSVDLEHGSAVELADELGVVVVSVDYRLAPEHPYPAAVEDCYAALRFLARLPGVDPARIGVHGQSAGGGLAAATALVARDRGGPALRFQSLWIPELDDRLETPSMRTFVDSPLWSRTQAAKSWEYYLGGRPADQYAAPARAEVLDGLPAAHVATAELDPLRDEGLTYAMRLLAAGVSVEVHNFPGTFHGSIIVTDAAVSRRMQAELIGALRRGLVGPAVPTRTAVD